MQDFKMLAKKIEQLEKTIECFKSLLLQLAISQDYSDETIINHLNVDKFIVDLYRGTKD